MLTTPFVKRTKTGPAEGLSGSKENSQGKDLRRQVMKWTLLQPEGDDLKTRKETACVLDGGQEGKGIHRKK